MTAWALLLQMPLLNNWYWQVKKVIDAKVAILGITFKENCPDVRNSKVIDIVKRLKEYGISPDITDPLGRYHRSKK